MLKQGCYFVRNVMNIKNCQEFEKFCQKSQENVRRVDEFLVMSGKYQKFSMMC